MEGLAGLEIHDDITSVPCAPAEMAGTLHTAVHRPLSCSPAPLHWAARSLHPSPLLLLSCSPAAGSQVSIHCPLSRSPAPLQWAAGFLHPSPLLPLPCSGQPGLRPLPPLPLSCSGQPGLSVHRPLSRSPAPLQEAAGSLRVYLGAGHRGGRVLEGRTCLCLHHTCSASRVRGTHMAKASVYTGRECRKASNYCYY